MRIPSAGIHGMPFPIRSTTHAPIQNQPAGLRMHWPTTAKCKSTDGYRNNSFRLQGLTSWSLQMRLTSSSKKKEVDGCLLICSPSAAGA